MLVGMQKTAVIVPCYNEAERLRPNEFSKAVDENSQLFFIFVDDGSTDGTALVLEELCRSHAKQMFLVRLDKNAGKAEAVRQGFLKAFAGDYVYVGYWDADLATPLSAVGVFCDVLDVKKAGLVMGSRVGLMGRKIRRNQVRHYLGRIFATGASFVLGLRVYDTQCGAKLFRRTPALESVFRVPFSVNWIFDVEVLARLLVIERRQGGVSVRSSTVELPLEEWNEVGGSKIKFKDLFLSGLGLVKIFLFMRSARMQEEFLKG
ncbi:Undecaprenyl-phosphate 4-deoxy-4-formamido-L-arabinose transferase [uncultured archaeon]|nr:Undecaprenyl-phosphate 4-deoxy-4-formamido-L-arabinose transferase [uncultured archaeon]